MLLDVPSSGCGFDAMKFYCMRSTLVFSSVTGLSTRSSLAVRVARRQASFSGNPNRYYDATSFEYDSLSGCPMRIDKRVMLGRLPLTPFPFHLHNTLEAWLENEFRLSWARVTRECSVSDFLDMAQYVGMDLKYLQSYLNCSSNSHVTETRARKAEAGAAWRPLGFR